MMNKILALNILNTFEDSNDGCSGLGPDRNSNTAAACDLILKFT